MNSDKIDYFMTTAKYLNISLAARQLYISQPALSRQLTSIEEEWGVKLFERTTKKVELTPAGKLIYNKLPELIKEYNQLIQEAGKLQQPEVKQLNISIPDGEMLPEMVNDAIHDLLMAYPELEINISRLSMGGLTESFNLKKVDVVFCIDFNMENMVDINYLPIVYSKVYVTMSKHYFLSRRLNVTGSLSDFAQEPFIIISPKEYPIASPFTLDACRKAGFTPRIIEAGTCDELELLVESGLGIGLLTDVSEIVNKPNIQTFPCKELMDRFFVIGWHKKDSSWAVREFINILKTNR